MTQYKVKAKAYLDWYEGDEFDHEFATAEEELEALNTNRVEVVPSQWLVIGPNEVYGHKTGEKFSAALPAYQAQQLIEAGHIEPVKDSKAAKKADEKSEEKPGG